MKYQDPLVADRQHAVPDADRAVHRGEHAATDRDGSAGDPAHERAARGERHGRAGRDLLDHRHRADHRRLATSTVTRRRQPRAGRARRRARDGRHDGLQQRRRARSRSSSSSRAPPTAGRCRRRATGNRSARRPTSRSTRPVERTSADVTLSAADLDKLSGTTRHVAARRHHRRAWARRRPEPRRDGCGRVERSPCSNRTAATVRA